MTIDQAAHIGATSAADDGTALRVATRKHSLASRWMHWINFPLLLIMLWSGLRIYGASDTHALDILGIRFEFFPESIFDFFEANRRLAKGLAYHLTFGWFFAINGLVFVTYLGVTGKWREIVPNQKALRDVPASIGHDLGIRNDAPEQDKYNPAQQLAYTVVLVMGAVMLASGFAIYKPTQLKPLTWALGGYETARLIHFATALALVGFFFVHVLQVMRAGWRNFAGMVTGYEVSDVAAGDQPPQDAPELEPTHAHDDRHQS